MAEKKGLFRRIFSFGAHDQETPTEGVTVAPTESLPPAPPEPESDATAAPEPTAVEETLIAGDGGAPVEPEIPEQAPVTEDPEREIAVAPAPVEAAPGDEAEDDFSWLEKPEPEADEPEADFSWLESPSEPQGDIQEEEPAPVEQPEPAALAAEEPTEAIESPESPEPDKAEDEAEADFSWLDAPLAPEEAEEEKVEARLVEEDGGTLPDVEESLPATSAEAPTVVTQPATLPPAPEAGEGWRRRAAPAPVLAPAPKVPWYQRLRHGLSRSSDQLTGSITALFTKRRLDEETLQDFEDVLIQADLGVETAMKITGRLSEGRFGKEISGEAVRAILAEEVESALAPVAVPLELDLDKKPHVVLVVGVNGTGKTTTIGKLAAKLTRGGLKVTLCAGDTFRAAAVEQLKIWGERTGSPVIAKQIGADAAGLAFEAYDAALANGSDVLIIDTAGRLQNKAELMAELEKIVRVLRKREPDAPHTVLQTLDATTGQNALSQVEIFRNVAGVNGLVMTKLDGTARGGILVAIAAKHRLPVYFVGVGEGIDDLEPFKARDFARAIAGLAA
ncbi:signal recognition particle-docking protein FtsY [Consotaella salsifontis]|uniref:Signal recognition particle receptor FtsY n=1 Tax=Consotaella salsifontis TaxID=1365950 RepID=A0A1T4QL50_9HYPH|nr:signal recognition particle-docking protein FtsY [Consotaella salsifontis]SKA04439.1 signal recognition particle-docking protein FtsY [Consotaella salsifontis]